MVPSPLHQSDPHHMVSLPFIPTSNVLVQDAAPALPYLPYLESTQQTR